MIYYLDQHIYTTKGLAFATAAESPGVGREIRAELEARARHYSGGAAEGDPPLVFRAFPILSSGTFAVSLLIDTGAGGGRAGGNYLAHSYVIPRPLLEEVGFNLAWVAAYLPILENYRPNSGPGGDPLDPLPCEVDATAQFRLVSLLVRELGPTEVRKLLGHLILHLSGHEAKGPLVLGMPPPHSALDELIAETLGGPERTPPPTPSPDRLRLWRLAAALAFLPTTFRQATSFTLNETRARQEWGSGTPWAIAVLRTPVAEFPAASTQPWIDHCIDLASRGQLEELERMQAWLSRPLCIPSWDALDRGFAFYRMLVSPQPETELPSIRVVVGISNAFRNIPGVEVRPLYEAAQRYVEQTSPSVEERLEIYVALCSVAARTQGHSDPDLIESVVDCLAESTSQGADKRAKYFLDLPMVIQKQVWSLTDVRGTPPAHVSLNRAKAPTEFIFLSMPTIKMNAYVPPDRAEASIRADLHFALQVINPQDWDFSRYDRERIAERFVKILQSAGSKSKGVLPRGRATLKESLNPTQAGIRTLIEVGGGAEVHKEFLGDLAKVFASDLLQRLQGSYSQHSQPTLLRDLAVGFLWDLVAEFLFGSGSPLFVADVLARVTVALESNISVVLDLVYKLGPGSDRWRTRLFLESLDSYCHPYVREQLAVQREFIDSLGGKFETRRTSAGPEIALPHYEAWLKSEANRRTSREDVLSSRGYRGFHDQLRETVRQLPVADFLPVAAGYLCLNPYVEDGLLEAVIDRLQANPQEVGRLLLSERRPGLARELLRPSRLIASIVDFTFRRSVFSFNKERILKCFRDILQSHNWADRMELLPMLDKQMSDYSWDPWKDLVRKVKKSW